MIRTALAIRLGFNEYYGFNAKVTMDTHTFKNIYSDSTYILNSVFSDISYSSALSLSSSSKYIFLYVELCAFYRCINGKDGGCIYYHANNGNCFIEKVCAHSCCAESGAGQFIYCTISDLMRVEFNVVTITQCAPITMGDSTKGSAIFLSRGQAIIRGINLSECTAGYNSGIELKDNKNASIVFSTLHKNVALSNQVCYVYQTVFQYSYEFNMNNTNVINNRPYTYCISFSMLHSKFNSCVFLENYAWLIHSNTRIFLNSCYIFHAFNSIVPAGTLSTFDLSISTIITETIAIQRYSTYHCYNELNPYTPGEPCQTMYHNTTECICSAPGELDLGIVTSVFASLYHFSLIA